jgi:hypothetical protein
VNEQERQNPTSALDLDMVHSTYVNDRTSISSLLGTDYTEPDIDEEEELANGGIAQDVDRMFEQLDEVEEESMDEDASHEGSAYQSEEESIGGSSQATFSPYCQKVTPKKELPTPLFAGKIDRLGVQLFYMHL